MCVFSDAHAPFCPQFFEACFSVMHPVIVCRQIAFLFEALETASHRLAPALHNLQHLVGLEVTWKLELCLGSGVAYLVCCFGSVP